MPAVSSTPTPTPTPALPAPAGRTAFDNADSTLREWQILCAALCLSVTSVLFFLRTYVKLVIRHEWTFEDYMAVASWLGLVAYSALSIVIMQVHSGYHEWDVTQEQLQTIKYWFNVNSIEYGITMVIIKLTILLLYRRTFITRVAHRSFNIALRLFEAILLLFYTIITIVKIFECTPRARIWDPDVPGTCLNAAAILETSGLFNVVTDIILILIPIKSVWNLKITKKQKWHIVGVVTFGALGPVVSIIGYMQRQRIASKADWTYYQPMIVLWADAEVSTGMSCLCLPPLWILIKRSSTFSSHTAEQAPESGCTPYGTPNLQIARKNSQSLFSNTLQGDEDLLYDDCVELNERDTASAGSPETSVAGRPESPPPSLPLSGTVTACVTAGARNHFRNAKGAWKRDLEAISDADFKLDGKKQSGVIVKTVRISQVYS